MDKDLEDILRRSKKGDSKPEPQKQPEKVFPKSEPYDYLVFTKVVRFSGFMVFAFLFLLPATMCIGFLLPGFYKTTIYALVVYGCLLVLYIAINQFRYRVGFKGWQERLPFQLIGWTEMIHEKKMFCDLCWNHTRIEVVLTNTSAELTELVQASLKLFVNRVKRAYYDIETGSSSTHNRNSWSIVSQTVAEGSANPEVMRYMKDLFEKELATIAKKTGAIQSVRISLLSPEFQIQIAASGD